jgi:hypothetical protein
MKKEIKVLHAKRGGINMKKKIYDLVLWSDDESNAFPYKQDFKTLAEAKRTAKKGLTVHRQYDQAEIIPWYQVGVDSYGNKQYEIGDDWWFYRLEEGRLVLQES